MIIKFFSSLRINCQFCCICLYFKVFRASLEVSQEHQLQVFPYIIAEMSANHNGKIENAFKIIECQSGWCIC